jgi:hypothetical protein
MQEFSLRAFAFAVAGFPHPPQTHVISTGGGALAAGVERSLYFAFVVATALVFSVAFASEIGLGFSLGITNHPKNPSALPKAGVQAKPERQIYCLCFCLLFEPAKPYP